MKDLRPVGPVEVEDGNRVREYYYNQQPGSTDPRPVIQHHDGFETELPNDIRMRLILWAGWLRGEK